MGVSGFLFSTGLVNTKYLGTYFLHPITYKVSKGDSNFPPVSESENHKENNEKDVSCFCF